MAALIPIRAEVNHVPHHPSEGFFGMEIQVPEFLSQQQDNNRVIRAIRAK